MNPLKVSSLILLLSSLAFPVKDALAGVISQNGIAFQYSDTTGEILNLVLPAENNALIMSSPEMASGSNPLKITWRVCSAPADRSLCIYAEVQNVSGRDLAAGEVFFPDFRGMRPLSAPGFTKEDTELRMGNGTINPFVGPSFSKEYAGGMYQPFSLRWIDFGNLSAGLSIYEQDWGTPEGFFVQEGIRYPIPNPTLLVERNDAVDSDGVRVAWKRHSSLAAEATFVSKPFILTAHRGGWAKGIEPFRKYVQGILNPAANTPQFGSAYKRLHPVPQHVKDGIGYQTLWMVEGQETECNPVKNFSYNDLPAISSEAREHGIDEIVLFGATRYGPVPVMHERKAGTIGDLQEGVRDARTKGVNLSMFFNVGSAYNSEVSSGNFIDVNYCYFQPLNPNFIPKKDFWSFHTEFNPSIEAAREVANDFPVQRNSMANTMVPLQRLQTLSSPSGFPGPSWAGRGITSFSMDEANDDFNPEDFYYAVNTMRARIAQANPAVAHLNTFSGEPFWGSMERAAIALDYTWGWVDYLESGPYLNAVKYPRLAANISFSPRAVKMAFADGLYMNVMPSKPNGANGSAKISSVPNVSKALRTVATLRHKFLPYFRDGVFIGESILARLPEPFLRLNKANHVGAATLRLEKFEYQNSFIKAHTSADGNRFLIVALNNSASRRSISYDVNAPVWMGASTLTNTMFKSYLENGDANGNCAVTKNSDNTWRITTPSLNSLEMSICEIIR